MGLSEPKGRPFRRNILKAVLVVNHQVGQAYQGIMVTPCAFQYSADKGLGGMRRHIQFAETGNVGFQLVGIDRHIIIGLFALASRLHAGHHGSVKRLQIGFTLKVICQRHRIFGRDIQPVVTRQKRQE